MTDFLRNISWQFYLLSEFLPEIYWEEVIEEIIIEVQISFCWRCLAWSLNSCLTSLTQRTTEATLDVLRPVFEDRIRSRRANVVWPHRKNIFQKRKVFGGPCRCSVGLLDLSSLLAKSQLIPMQNLFKSIVHSRH